jgi:osmoprotectant transport system ATP-binding protein
VNLSLTNVAVVYNEGEWNETVGLPPVSFSLRRGEPLVLHGPNGCGKTTLLKLLAGSISKFHGSIRASEGRNENIYARWLRRHAIFLRQQSVDGLFSDLTLGENLVIACAESRWFDPYFPSQVFQNAESSLARLVAFYPNHRAHRVSELSGGQQQLFAIGCAGVTARPLLLFDEPTSALDRNAAAKAEELLRALCLQPGIISLIVTHDKTLAGKLGFSSIEFEEIAVGKFS